VIRFLIRRRIRAFGRRFSHDTRYMEEILDEDLPGFLIFHAATLLSGHRFGLPVSPLFAAKFVATRAAGCGPCVELVIAMAAAAGVAPGDLAKAGRPEAEVEAGMRLAADFAFAVTGQTADLPDRLAEVERVWGRRGRIGLAAAIATAQFYPTLKRSMGHAQSCDVLPEPFRLSSTP